MLHVYISAGLGIWCRPMERILKCDLKEVDEDYEKLSSGQQLMADRLLVRFEDQVKQVAATDLFVTRRKLKKLVAGVLS